MYEVRSEYQGTRLEVTAELNQLLEEQLEELKSQGVKRMNKKILLEQLCRAGLEFQKNGGQLSSINGQEKGVVLETAKDLHALKESLMEKEEELRSFEKRIRKRERQIYKDYDILAAQRTDLSNELDKYIKSNATSILNELQLKEKEKQVNNLEEENRKLSIEIIQTLKKIDSKTEKDIFLDKILPFVTPAMVGWLIIRQLGIKIPEKRINPLVQDMIKALKTLSDSEKKQMIEEIAAVIAKYANKNQQKQDSMDVGVE